MTKEIQKIRRTHYFIKRGFQFSFILKFCLLVLIGVILSTGLLLLFSQDTLTSSFDQSKLMIEKTSLAILPAAVYTNLITLGLISFATIVITLFVSHKLAGPMFRFESDLEVIRDGDLTKQIRLRKKDQFMDMVDSLNRMTGGLRAKILNIQDSVDGIMEIASDQNAPHEVINGLEDLQEMIKTNFKV